MEKNKQRNNKKIAEKIADNKNNKNKYIIYLHWTSVILYMMVIFYFSSQDGMKSHEVSSGLLQYIKLFVLIIPGNIFQLFSKFIKNYEYVLRKAAHFTEYLILALIFYKAMIVSNVRAKKSLFISLIFCFLYAVSDEVHQIFVPGRAFAVKDILIDTAGAAVGLSIVTMNKYLKNKKAANVEE